MITIEIQKTPDQGTSSALLRPSTQNRKFLDSIAIKSIHKLIELL